MTNYTSNEKVMKHVISLSLMTLHIAALADLNDKNSKGIIDTISKAEAMIASELDIPMKRVGELFQIVIDDLSSFEDLSEEVEKIISQMEGARA